ncbi:MAG: carbohydrate kinase family protein [Oscillospiraceae bacterium]|nr:carbohydrate kinase family protein [Oscillospiraceae bacterium]
MQNIPSAARVADAILENRIGYKALIGLDGFVDELMQVVDKRESAEVFTKVGTLAALGDRISRAAGLSTNIELVGLVQKLGGNGPILANALAELGVDVSCIGALGKKAIHPVFAPMGEKCRLISITDPGLSFNLEFDDGKLIMGKHDSLVDINWPALKEQFDLDVLADMLNPANIDLLGLENWVMIPHMSGIFEGIVEEVFPLIEAGESLAFFDLCDPEKRLPEDISRALGLISRFSARYKVCLGVNLKEAAHLAHALGINGFDEMSGIDLKEITVALGKALGIHCFVIHTVREASAYCGGEYYLAPGYFTPQPVLTTGAGDNFNAGFCLGMLLGLSVSEALLLGNASSGYYVRAAGSATSPELVEFMRNTHPVSE